MGVLIESQLNVTSFCISCDIDLLIHDHTLRTTLAYTKYLCHALAKGGTVSFLNEL